MIAQLNDIAQIWWQWMGSMFWQVNLLIILVTALDMAIRRWAWPQVRYALWTLVFIKLIIPPTWQMPTSIVSRIQPKVEEQISIQIQTNEDRKGNSQAIFFQNTEEPPVAIEKATWQTFALSGWISGVVFFSLMLLRKMWRFRKWQQVQASRSAPRWLNDLIVNTTQHLKLKRVPSVIFSKGAKTPAVYGLFRPVLLLPHGYLDQLSKEQAEHVLMHELCHLKRGDLLIHWFCIVLQIIYWFNPLIIWTRRQMRHVCEICCDLSVANILREKTTKYRDTLLRTARELFAESMEPSLGFLGIFEEPFRLLPRLKWLEKKSWENRKRRIAVTICTSLIMITCVMPMAGLSQPEAQNNNLMAQSDYIPVESSEQQESNENGVSEKLIHYDILLVEVDVNKGIDLGAEWLNPTSGRQTDKDDSPAIPNDFPIGILKEGIKIDGESFTDIHKLISRMKEADKNIKVLSTPKVLGRSGESVKLSSGSRENELSLEISPEIVGDNIIQQDIKIAVKHVDEELNGTFRQKSFETKVIVKEGSTFVIGGIPGKDVDITDGNNKEICIFITPHIIYPTWNQANDKDMEKEQVRRFSEPDSDDSQSARYFDMNFHDVDIMEFIKYISEITGKSFVVGNKVRGKVSVIGAEKVTVDEAYDIFESVLEVHGFTTETSGQVIKIVTK